MKTLFALSLTAILSLPMTAFAAGSAVPAATNPNKDCKAGEVFDAKTNTCVSSQSGSLLDKDRLNAARYFAYAGDYDAASLALAALNAPDTADALTLRGFVARKMGDFDTGMAHYTAALALDQNHWQARSYMGQGFVEAGNSDEARAQLTLIRTTGGRGTWAEVSLRQAIASGTGYSY